VITVCRRLREGARRIRQLFLRRRFRTLSLSASLPVLSPFLPLPATLLASYYRRTHRPQLCEPLPSIFARSTPSLNLSSSTVARLQRRRTEARGGREIDSQAERRTWRGRNNKAAGRENKVTDLLPLTRLNSHVLRLFFLRPCCRQAQRTTDQV
jgi:hypothetical protein